MTHSDFWKKSDPGEGTGREKSLKQESAWSVQEIFLEWTFDRGVDLHGPGEEHLLGWCLSTLGDSEHSGAPSD